jgi:hypothetical protein
MNSFFFFLEFLISFSFHLGKLQQNGEEFFKLVDLCRGAFNLNVNKVLEMVLTDSDWQVCRSWKLRFP